MAGSQHLEGKGGHAIEGGGNLAGAGGKQAVKVVPAVLEQFLPAQVVDIFTAIVGAEKLIAVEDAGVGIKAGQTARVAGGGGGPKLQVVALPQVQPIIAAANHPHPGGDIGEQVPQGQGGGVRTHHRHLRQPLQEQLQGFYPVGVDVTQDDVVDLVKTDLLLQAFQKHLVKGLPGGIDEGHLIGLDQITIGGGAML